MARTFKNTVSGAKNNILGNAAIRYVSFILAFVGIMTLVMGTSVTREVFVIVGIALLLVGVLLISGNLKLLFSKSAEKKKGASLYLLIGVLLLVCGVLLWVLASQISKWINLIFGILIAVYGLIILIRFILHRKSNKFFMVLDCIICSLMIVSGVMLAISFKVTDHTFVTITGVIATVAGGLGLITY